MHGIDSPANASEFPQNGNIPPRGAIVACFSWHSIKITVDDSARTALLLHRPNAKVRHSHSLNVPRKSGAERSMDQQSFAGGGSDTFTVDGVPVAKSAGVVDWACVLRSTAG
jgi:hypothetical protein